MSDDIQAKKERKRIYARKYYLAHREEIIAASCAYSKARIIEKRKTVPRKKGGTAKRPAQTQKKCVSCDVLRPATDFGIIKATGRLRQKCKDCISVANREYRHNNKEAIKAYRAGRPNHWEAYGREKWTASEDVVLNSYFRRQYGFSLRHYREMLAAQDGVCAICKTVGHGKNSTRLHIDHDHKTGKLRALLCFQCNVGLGKFKDNSELLLAAARYLESFT